VEAVMRRRVRCLRAGGSKSALHRLTDRARMAAAVNDRKRVLW
jgi:hypothetical protein